MEFLTGHIVEAIIILWAIGTGIVYGFTWREAHSLRELLMPRERRANPKEKPRSGEIDEKQFEDLVIRRRDRMNLLYTLFTNATSALPLWGMFGTVVSLIGLAGRLTADSDMPVDSFFSALWTTAFGIIFAIAYKTADSFVSVHVAANNKEADTLLHRNSIRRQKGAFHEV